MCDLPLCQGPPRLVVDNVGDQPGEVRLLYMLDQGIDSEIWKTRDKISELYFLLKPPPFFRCSGDRRYLNNDADKMRTQEFPVRNLFATLLIEQQK